MKSRNMITETVVKELTDRAEELTNYGEAKTGMILVECSLDLEAANKKVEENPTPANIKNWKDVFSEAVDYLQPYE